MNIYRGTRRRWQYTKCPLGMVSIGILLLSLLSFPALGQVDPTVLDLPHDWQVGQSFRLELTRDQQEFLNGDLVDSTRTRTSVRVDVTEKSAEGYAIRWTYGRTDVISGADKDDPITAAVIKIYENLTLVLKTDPLGNVIEIKNTDEVNAKMRLAIEEILHYIDDLSPSKGVAALLRKGLEPIFTTLMIQEDQEASIWNDPHLLFLASGRSYPLGTPVTYDDLLPNPFGGASIPSRAYFLLQEIDSDNNRAIIEWGQSLDPAKTAALIRETVDAALQNMGLPPPSDDDIPLVQIDEVSQYEIDLTSGLPSSLTYEANSTVGPKSSVERLIFQMVPE